MSYSRTDLLYSGGLPAVTTIQPWGIRWVPKALGLPYIKKEEYDGEEFSVSEYTMSEIIASVYKLRKETGCREGILFLDEINCVSETLAPSMLQFLQYKVFGTHGFCRYWAVSFWSTVRPWRS